MIHPIKGFNIVNEAEVDVFMELLCFFHDPTNVGSLISGSSAFSKSSFCIWSSWFTYCWSLAWRILSMTLLACEMSAVVWCLVAQLCLTLCDPMDCSPPGSSVYGVSLAKNIGVCCHACRSRGSSQPRDWIQVFCIAGGFFTIWAIREAQEYWNG